jgi:hypothetical protein
MVRDGAIAPPHHEDQASQFCSGLVLRAATAASRRTALKDIYRFLSFGGFFGGGGRFGGAAVRFGKPP